MTTFKTLLPGVVVTIAGAAASAQSIADIAAGGVAIADGTGEFANVIIADIKAYYGVIHMVDKVLLPDARPAHH